MSQEANRCLTKGFPRPDRSEVLIAQSVHEHHQTRRHSNRLLAHADGKPFTDLLAEGHVMRMADLDVALMRGSHETSMGVGKGNQETWNYRRAVTRRASWIFAPESGLRKQDWARYGQTCVEQSETTARTSSRSPLARAAASPACTVGAKPGTAITAAPRRQNIARAERDFIILSC